MHSTDRPSSLLLVASLAVATTVVGQCSTVLAPPLGVPGTNGDVLALAEWDPDGTGPSPRVVVLGGNFTVAGTVRAFGIATYEPASGTFAPLSTTTDGAIEALTVLPNGHLLAVGQFTSIGGVPAARVARYDGANWHALGSGANARVTCAAAFANGDVVIGGDFTVAGGIAAQRLARFDGVAWHPLGVGANALVRALAVRPNGDLVAGGDFLNLGAPNRHYVASWNGASWSPLGNGVDGPVQALVELQNGDLAVGGIFSSAGVPSTVGIARWNGSTWSAFGPGLATSLFGAPVYGIAQAPNGDVVAVGSVGAFSTPSPYRYVARFDGTNWVAVGSGINGVVRSVASTSNGHLYVGGVFTAAGTAHPSRIAKWDGTAWSALATGFDRPVVSLEGLGDEAFLAGGSFTTVDGQGTPALARFDGSAWNAIGSGPFGIVTASASLPNGDVFVNLQGSRVQRYTGGVWQPLTPALNADTSAFAQLTNGDLVLGGAFTGAPFPNFFPARGLAVWNGTSLSPFAGGAEGGVYSLLPAANDSLYVGGTITQVGGSLAVAGIAYWNGTSWSSLGSGVAGAVYSLARANNGDVIAAGSFLTAGGVLCNSIARWDGSAWHALGSGVNGAVNRVVVLPNGDVVAGGLFTTAGGVPCHRIARWDGAAWHPFGLGADGSVDALAVTASGDLLVGGQFSYFDGQPCPYFARLQPSCRALAVPVGTGCLGANLEVVARAWAGGTCIVRGTGLPQPSLAVFGTGFTLVSIGLDALFAEGVSGCPLLLVGDPSLTQAVLANGGIAEGSLSIPRDPVLVGVAFRQQMVPVQFDAQGGITAITSTNAIDHVIGSS